VRVARHARGEPAPASRREIADEHPIKHRTVIVTAVPLAEIHYEVLPDSQEQAEQGERVAYRHHVRTLDPVPRDSLEQERVGRDESIGSVIGRSSGHYHCPLAALLLTFVRVAPTDVRDARAAHATPTPTVTSFEFEVPAREAGNAAFPLIRLGRQAIRKPIIGSDHIHLLVPGEAQE
jgi:hypothetical protein